MTNIISHKFSTPHNAKHYVHSLEKTLAYVRNRSSSYKFMPRQNLCASCCCHLQKNYSPKVSFTAMGLIKSAF